MMRRIVTIKYGNGETVKKDTIWDAATYLIRKLIEKEEINSEEEFNEYFRDVRPRNLIISDAEYRIQKEDCPVGVFHHIRYEEEPTCIGGTKYHIYTEWGVEGPIPNFSLLAEIAEERLECKIRVEDRR